MKDSIYPVQLASKISDDGATVTNLIVGGITFREHIAIECLKGLLSNPALVSVTKTEKLREVSMTIANAFEKDLRPEGPTGGPLTDSKPATPQEPTEPPAGPRLVV